MFFLSDGIANVPGDRDSEEYRSTVTDSYPSALSYTSDVVGEVVAFEVMVNNVVDPNFGISDVVPGPVGFMHGHLIVSSLNPFYGAVNRVNVAITLRRQTTADQHSLDAENGIPVAMPGATQLEA